jgi:hypothetical protein
MKSAILCSSDKSINFTKRIFTENLQSLAEQRENQNNRKREK